MIIRKDLLEEIFDKLSTDTKSGHEDVELSIKLGTVGEIKLIDDLKASVSARRFLNPNDILYYLYKQIKTLNSNSEILKTKPILNKSTGYIKLKSKIKKYLTT